MAHWLFVLTALVPAAEPVHEKAQARRPIAAIVVGEFAYIANRDSASLSVLDVEKREVVAEHRLGAQPSHMVELSGDRAIVSDEQNHTVSVLRLIPTELERITSTSVSRYPVRLAVHELEDHAIVAVASLWSRRLEILELRGDELKSRGRLNLESAPRSMAFLDDAGTKLLVADNFAGSLSLISTTEPKLLSTRGLYAHSIRGIARDSTRGEVLLSYQMLAASARTDTLEIHWGGLMASELRWLSEKRLLDPAGDIYEDTFVLPLGLTGNGSADSTDLVALPNGAVMVAIGGTSEVVFDGRSKYERKRVKVGRRPSSIALTDDGAFAVVACTFDDSVSIIDINERAEAARVSLGPDRELTTVERGESLFYNSRLSHDGWMSCHSCHTDGHTNGGRNDNSSDGSFGTPKIVISLLGVADTAPLAWDGKTDNLVAQIHRSTRKTMRGRGVSSDDANAIAAYLTTLPPPPSVAAARGEHDEESMSRGEDLFKSLRCTKCHRPPVYTSEEPQDVGLEDAGGLSEYSPPSLRGVSQRWRFFHDGRAESLEEVFEKHRHQLTKPLSSEELRDLLAFLGSL